MQSFKTDLAIVSGDYILKFICNCRLKKYICVQVINSSIIGYNCSKKQCTFSDFCIFSTVSISKNNLNMLLTK